MNNGLPTATLVKVQSPVVVRVPFKVTLPEPPAASRASSAVVCAVDAASIAFLSHPSSSEPSAPPTGVAPACAISLASTLPRCVVLAARTRRVPSSPSSRPSLSPVWGLTLPRLMGVAMAASPASPLGMPRWRMPVTGSYSALAGRPGERVSTVICSS